MTTGQQPPSVLVVIADDDHDDCTLVVDAWTEIRGDINTRCVANGRELLDFLNTITAVDGTLPAVVLLDLNMPLMDGWATLAALKQDATLRSVPVIVFTTSSVPEHVRDAYDLQAAGFVTKPSSYHELVSVLTGIDQYWLSTVTPPPER